MTKAAEQLLFCDSDCLIQLFSCKEIRLLGDLRRVFGLKAVIVPEVESELSWHTKFEDRWAAPLAEAIRRGHLSVYEEPPEELAAAIKDRGAQYSARVDTGEAYTFAWATVLNAPALSHDRSAIETLTRQKLQVPQPVLRVLDLLVFAAESGLRTEQECNRATRAIRGRSKKPDKSTGLWSPAEWLPREFLNTSFAKGKPSFSARLRLRNAGSSSDRAGDALFLQRIEGTPAK